jgi:hypothetical protein
MTDDELLRAFESQSLPLENWCHELHLRVAYLYLLAAPFDSALERLRAGIQAYNAAQQVPEGLESGYHESLTVCWLCLVAASMGEGTHGDSEAFRRARPELHDKRRVLEYYSREHLLTERAKREFVDPDLQPLLGPSGAGCGIPDGT